MPAPILFLDNSFAQVRMMYLHALPGESCFQHEGRVLINRFRVGEPLVPLDQSAVVDALLPQREAEAEAHNRKLPRLWPAMRSRRDTSRNRVHIRACGGQQL